MKTERNKRILKILEELLQIGALFILTISIVLIGIAIFDTNNKGEAPIGSFRVDSFNDGWTIVDDGDPRPVEVPTKLDKAPGEMATIVNTLPATICNGTNLMIRASMEDVYIYVGGKERAKYSSDSIEGMSYYIPSAYVVAELDAADAGSEVRILFRFKTAGVINEITLSHGGNVWFSVITSVLPVNAAAAIVLAMGLILFAAALFLGGSFRIGAARQLALLMINTSLWVFSESKLRQFIFLRPSLSQFFAYFLVEMIGVFACMFFDEVQHRRYHKRYLVCETLAFLQILVNIVLHASGIQPFYRTLLFSHIWTGVCAVVAIVCIVTDFVTRRSREYPFTLFGIIGFTVLSLVELALFYINPLHVFGTWICLALILLMTATIIQTVYDEAADNIRKEKNQTAMTITTIETIAGAIDARDEYTGGHSERVGLYASRLAREMAADYDLSEEDILRVHYIGLVHDIGKIGVADNVLNKSGRLTEEEFSLMKKHTEIGYEIMSSLGDSIEGLLDGIRYHHERFDGNGYPDGLSDTDIPLIARILAIADSYDAMTSNRVYRSRLTDEQVRGEFRRCSGTQFDPALTEIFLRLLEQGEMNAYTVDGAAADSVGKVHMSSLLETRLQQDMREGIAVESPPHVRMLCYLMKLMEKKGRDYRVFFLTLKGIWADPPTMWETGAAIGTDAGRRATESVLTSLLRGHLSQHDVNIRYTQTTNIVALYDRDDAQTEEFLTLLSQICPKAKVESLE